MLTVVPLAVSVLSVAMSDPVLCTDINLATTSVVAGRVEQRTMTIESWSLFGETNYEILATVRPTRTLRGERVSGGLTARAYCSTSTLDLSGQRWCRRMLSVGASDTFMVDRRRMTADANPLEDEVRLYDRWKSNPLPQCVRA